MAQNGLDGEPKTAERPSRAALAWQARCLLRAARVATLATAEAGQPNAALVTPACAPDGSVLVLLSGLSAHTRQLASDGRCALLVTGDPTGPNPQTTPRLTVLGEAAPDPDPALKARWLARHPYAAFYAGFPDFRLLRIRVASGQFVAGFGAALTLAAPDLLPDAAAVAAVAAAEPGVIAHMNADHADAVDRMAGSPGWRMAAVDTDGCDLIRDEAVTRISWSAPVADAHAIRKELIRLVSPTRGDGR